VLRGTFVSAALIQASNGANFKVGNHPEKKRPAFARGPLRLTDWNWPRGGHAKWTTSTNSGVPARPMPDGINLKSPVELRSS